MATQIYTFNDPVVLLRHQCSFIISSLFKTWPLKLRPYRTPFSLTGISYRPGVPTGRANTITEAYTITEICHYILLTIPIYIHHGII